MIIRCENFSGLRDKKNNHNLWYLIEISTKLEKLEIINEFTKKN